MHVLGGAWFSWKGSPERGSRQGGTERTLTAAAGPPPRDPYRNAFAMRPPQKVRPFSFLNYYRL